MTVERLKISLPDDQVCQDCHAVALDMDAHGEWHARFYARLRGVEDELKVRA